LAAEEVIEAGNADLELHRLLAELARNPFLISAMSTIVILTRLGSFSDPLGFGARADIASALQKLLDALSAGDASRARAGLRATPPAAGPCCARRCRSWPSGCAAADTRSRWCATPICWSPTDRNGPRCRRSEPRSGPGPAAARRRGRRGPLPHGATAGEGPARRRRREDLNLRGDCGRLLP